MKRSFILSTIAVFSLSLAATAPAFAQATRTWVSGTGDDANPCSRTAPCKTFAGAISKTASGGEINVLDPGGFGAVTITKPITISSWDFEAGVLVSGTNGIVVNVPNAADTVILRGLDIEGLGTGISGVSVITGGNVTVENCTINNFTNSGINFAPTVSGSQLHVSNTVVRNNGIFTIPASGQGILVNPSGTAAASLDHVRLDRNVAGLKVQGASKVAVSDSVAANNAFAGYSAATSGATMSLERSMASHNAASGAAAVVCNAGTTVHMGNVSFNDNNGTTMSTGGTCLTYKNNDADVTFPAGTTPVNPQ
jgi:hypothetical protein